MRGAVSVGGAHTAGGRLRAMAGFRCAKCGKVAMVQKLCCGRPMKRS